MMILSSVEVLKTIKELFKEKFDLDGGVAVHRWAHQRRQSLEIFKYFKPRKIFEGLKINHALTDALSARLVLFERGHGG